MTFSIEENQQDYYTVQQHYGEKFYKLPMVLFTNPLYKNLTDTEKVAYAILSNRCSLSIKNKWFDKKGRIYFRYSNRNLEEILGKSNKTVVKIKKSLVEVGLLEIKKVGLTQSDILYLKRPIVTADDIYSIKEEEENSVEVKEKQVEESPQILDTPMKCKKVISENEKSSPLEEEKVHTNKTEFNKTEIKKIKDKPIPIPIPKKEEKQKEKVKEKEKVEQGISNDLFHAQIPQQIKTYLKDRIPLLAKINFNVIEFERFCNSYSYYEEYADFENVDYINAKELYFITQQLIQNVDHIEKTTFGLMKNWCNRYLSYKKDNLLDRIESQKANKNNETINVETIFNKHGKEIFYNWLDN